MNSQRFNICSSPLRRATRALWTAGAATLLIASPTMAQQPAPGVPVRLTLGDAARLAARQNAQAQEARYRAQAADARVKERRADLLPNLSGMALQSGRTFNTITFGLDFPLIPGQPPLFNPAGQIEGPVNTLDLRGRLAGNVFDFSAIERVRAARSSASAADAEAGNTADNAATVAAGAYLRLLNSNAHIKARLADSSLASQQLGIARDQLQAGVGVALDVTRAQSQVALVRSQLIAARNDADRARLDLLRALNLQLDAVVELADSLGSLVDDDVPLDEQAATERALRDRPDLRAAEEQLRAARQQVTAVRAERIPSVSGFVDDGVIGGNVNRLLPTYTYGVQLSLPVFDGFRREARIEEQQYQAREFEVRLRDLRLRTAIEVKGDILNITAARAQQAAAGERMRLAEQEVSQATDRFRAGVAGNLDVTTAALSLNTARTQYVDAVTAVQVARVALARDIGAVTQLP
jgi:outer membrane protein TolC